MIILEQKIWKDEELEKKVFDKMVEEIFFFCSGDGRIKIK